MQLQLQDNNYSHLPPTRSDASNIVTSILALRNSLAAAKPDNPAPIITTDVDDNSFVAFCDVNDTLSFIIDV